MKIFCEKINMDGFADFYLKKLAWIAMLIFPKKIYTEGHADFSQKITC